MSVVNYSNRANYRGVKINQRRSSLLHSFRQKIEEYQRHLDKEKSKLNEYFYFNMETNKLMKTPEPKKRMEEIEKNLKDIKSNFKEESQNSKEDLELKSKLNKQKHNTKNALKGKDLDLEEYEKSGLTPKDYIEKNWTKQYRNKNITNRMKKRTLESLEAYEEMKKTNNIELKETLNKKGMTTTLQELVFKITKNENNEEYTKEELLKIL